MSQTQIPKNKKPLAQFWTVWGIVAALVLIGVIFWGWKSWRLASENQRFEVSIENISARLDTLEPGSAAQNALRGKILMRATDSRVMWSKLMAQVLNLETSATQFSDIMIDDDIISATVQARDWSSLSSFVAGLRANQSVYQVRVESTTPLTESLSGATQEAKITFLFSPPTK